MRKDLKFLSTTALFEVRIPPSSNFFSSLFCGSFEFSTKFLKFQAEYPCSQTTFIQHQHFPSHKIKLKQRRKKKEKKFGRIHTMKTISRTKSVCRLLLLNSSRRTSPNKNDNKKQDEKKKCVKKYSKRKNNFQKIAILQWNDYEAKKFK